MADLPDADQPLVARSRDGDADAFTELVMRHQLRLRALARRLTGSAEDGDDVAQEVFVQAWQRLGEFRGEASFSTWLYRLTVNRALNWRQAHARHQRRVTAATAEREAAMENPSPDTAPAVRVRDALQRLDPAWRTAIVLTVYEGLSHAQAAHVLGCAETTVSWRLFRARRELKRLLSAP
jgi:RNA polymerase sigma-70 factor (ECF subfamily)